MVEVFKTNVQTKAQSEVLLFMLCRLFPSFKINFDLFDCDKILRVEGNDIQASKIISVLNAHQFQCEAL